jgi:hypothetical protein
LLERAGGCRRLRLIAVARQAGGTKQGEHEANNCRRAL